MSLRRGVSRPVLIGGAVVLVILILAALYLAFFRAPTAPPKEITFYTWWAGLEEPAIKALVESYTAKTGVKVIRSAVPGGAGVNAKFAIIALIMAGKPPEGFQVHCGPEMISYFLASPNKEADFVDLTQVGREIGVLETAVGRVCMLSGKLYTIPVNLHRANLIFMNKEVLDANGIKPPRTLDELIAASKALQAKGIPAMVQAGADLFTVLHLWEQIFLAVAGPQKFIEFMYGTLDPGDPSIKRATEIFLELAATFPPDWPALDWTAAVDRVVRGLGAFHVDGDWAVGLIYTAYKGVEMCPVDAITPTCKIIVAPFPGTEDVYNMVVDAVAVPKGPLQDLGVDFAKYFASREGQKVFNPPKGSIAVYPDVPPDIYPTVIQKWEVEQYRKSRYQVFSLTHGALFSDVWQKLLTGAVILAQYKAAALDSWYSTVKDALTLERRLWEQTGYYLGSPEAPFAGFKPPWAR
jgi:glucose/arabinose transport system substrate-binding protein